MALTHAEKTQNRYVELGDAIAKLTAEAGELEVAMSDGKYYPMTLGVYNGLAEAHRYVLMALHTLSQHTGVDVEVEQGVIP